MYVFIVLRRDRRQVVHFNVTTNPYAEWTAQQIINAFPYEEAPRFLIRDRDDIYNPYFTGRVEGMGIEEVPTAARSPWQNPYCERVIGSIRCECLNHVIVLSEGHLKRILASYLEYYHGIRPHLSLDRNYPVTGDIIVSDGTDYYSVFGVPVNRGDTLNPRGGYLLMAKTRSADGWSSKWNTNMPLTGKAMVLADDVVFVAGVPLVFSLFDLSC